MIVRIRRDVVITVPDEITPEELQRRGAEALRYPISHDNDDPPFDILTDDGHFILTPTLPNALVKHYVP